MKKIIFIFVASVLFLLSSDAVPVQAVASSYSVSLNSIPSSITKEGTYSFSYSVRSNVVNPDDDAYVRVCYLVGTRSNNPTYETIVKPIWVTGEVADIPGATQSASLYYGVLGSSYDMHFDPGLLLFDPQDGLTGRLDFTGQFSADAAANYGDNISVYVMCTIDYINADYSSGMVHINSNTVSTTLPDPCAGKTCGCGALPACQVATPTPTPTPTSTPVPTATPKAVSNTKTTPTPTATPTPTPVITEENWKEFFKYTDFFNQSSDKKKKVENFEISYEGGNSILFLENLDLSTITKESDLPLIFIINEKGKVSIDTTKYSFLNKKARITMTGLEFKKTPVILHNGVEDSSVVSDIEYNAETGTLVFTVSGFSTYEAVASAEENANMASERTVFDTVIEFSIDYWYIFAVVLLIISVVISVVVVKNTHKK
jgi:hypothetical protein